MNPILDVGNCEYLVSLHSAALSRVLRPSQGKIHVGITGPFLDRYLST